MAAVLEQQVADLSGLFSGHEVTALLLELSDNLIAVALFADHGLLGSADSTVIKGLGSQDLLDGLCHISGTLNVGRRVTGADAQSRLTSAVCSLHHAGAAGSDDHGSLLALHQLIGSAHGRHGQAADHVLRCACSHSGITHQRSSLQGALQCRGMGGEDNCVTSLDRDHGLVNRSRSGVGGRNDTHDQTHGISNFHHLVHGILMDDAGALHILDVIIYDRGCHVVLVGLILNLTKTGLLNCHLCQHHSVFLCDTNHVLQNFVNLLLRIIRQLIGCDLAQTSQITRLLNGLQIIIKVLHSGSSFQKIIMHSDLDIVNCFHNTRETPPTACLCRPWKSRAQQCRKPCIRGPGGAA